MQIGDPITYTDPKGVKHNALLTAVWGSTDDLENNPPSVNLVYVSRDESFVDSYGRQIARQTSCVHKSRQAAHGVYYELA